MEAFRDNGTSAHYVVDQDGDIIQIVPLHHRAFHAGVSRFGDHTSLNGCSIGVEIVNRGLAEHEEPGAVQLLGDGRWWFPFPPEQTRAVGLLVQALQARFRIPGWNVVGHMEIALGRKSDPGPLLDYRTLFVDYHGGFFPSEDPIVNRMEFLERLVEDDYHAILSLIGYRPPEGQWSLAIKAYQMHFSRGNISGELVEETKESLIHFVLDIHSYRDPYTGTRHTSFIAEFHTLVWTAPERFDPFFQHIPSLQAGE
jgi:N-acetyl-anhydromuramyl-L-alanine amidase AmpD